MTHVQLVAFIAAWAVFSAGCAVTAILLSLRGSKSEPLPERGVTISALGDGTLWQLNDDGMFLILGRTLPGGNA